MCSPAVTDVGSQGRGTGAACRENHQKTPETGTWVRDVPGRAWLLWQVGSQWVTLQKLSGELFCKKKARTPKHTHQGISQLQVKANSEGALGFSLHPEHHDLTSDYFLNTLL